MPGISIKCVFSCGQNGVSPQSTGKRGCARGALTLLQSGSTSTKTSRTISSSSVPSAGPWRPAVTGNRRHRKGECTIMLAAASSMTLFTRLTTRPGNKGGEIGEGGRPGNNNQKIPFSPCYMKNTLRRQRREGDRSDRLRDFELLAASKFYFLAQQRDYSAARRRVGNQFFGCCFIASERGDRDKRIFGERCMWGDTICIYFF